MDVVSSSALARIVNGLPCIVIGDFMKENTVPRCLRAGYTVSDRQVSMMVIWGAFGEMFVPMAISCMLEAESSNGTGVLYGLSAIISVAMVVVYVGSTKMAELGAVNSRD